MGKDILVALIDMEKAFDNNKIKKIIATQSLIYNLIFIDGNLYHTIEMIYKINTAYVTITPLMIMLPTIFKIYFSMRGEPFDTWGMGVGAMDLLCDQTFFNTQLKCAFLPPY